MPDRRQSECSTAEEIAQAKIDSIQLQQGDPSQQDVLRAMSAQLQKRSGVATEQAASTTGEDVQNSVRETQGLSGVESLDKRLRACLEQLRGDFDGRGIVRIDERGTKESYRAALKADKTDGKKWRRDIESRLLANDAALLKKAAVMPEGPFLVGFHANGDLAIRQRSLEIMNARWTEDWKDEDEESARGELLLLPHAEAKALPRGRWAKASEIVRKVREAGYHLPPDSPNCAKEGLVAASEAVMDSPYVISLDMAEWRSAMLECDENVSDLDYVRIVFFSSVTKCVDVDNAGADRRFVNRGAVLWVRG